MSETIIDEIPSSSNGSIIEIDHTVRESVGLNEEEETWLYRNNQLKPDENLDHTIAPSIDEVTRQEIDTREKPTTGFIEDEDDDSEDDEIRITIGNYEPEASAFHTNRPNNRTMLTTNPMMAPKPPITRGLDFDAQGVINGQSTYEYDITNAYKDEEKPWKKPGADITDYFNYGFTEEIWAQYCDRQRRLRAENNIARLNIAHMPPMPQMIQGHPAMGHPMNPHPMMMINKPMNMPMITRPMHIRKPDGKIGVIGTTDQTSRRPIFETSNNFEQPPFMNGPPFSGGQPSNGQTVGDLISTSAANNGHPPPHGNPSGGTQHISTLGVHRVQMMTLPPGMQFRPQFGHPHGPGGPQFFPRGPVAGMHGERPPQPYFVPRHPQQQWDKTGAPPMQGFPLGSFPPQPTVPINNNNNNRAPSSRSPTPENHSSRSPTPEENRPNISENDKSKDDRYKERYRDDRDHHASSRRRLSPKDRSSSGSYRGHHRGSEHEYERPRNDRKSSRDRDEKYERYSRKQHHRDDSTRHYRGEDESSHTHRSSRRTPPKIGSSPAKTTPTESSQTLNEQVEITSELDPSSTHRSDSERSSSRHSHHKKSSKRSRHDSGDEQDRSHHHHRRSKDKSSSTSKKSTNQSESFSDVKEQINE